MRREASAYNVFVLVAFRRCFYIPLWTTNMEHPPLRTTDRCAEPTCETELMYNLQTGCHSVLALIVCIRTMTGCGYPPLSVRAVAKKLLETLQIPALGLFDYNVS